jgi:hypothetical protein
MFEKCLIYVCNMIGSGSPSNRTASQSNFERLLSAGIYGRMAGCGDFCVESKFENGCIKRMKAWGMVAAAVHKKNTRQSFQFLFITDYKFCIRHDASVNRNF